MTDDEMRKKMEFIVNQQAQFFSDIGALRESLGELRETVGELTGVVARLAQATLDHVEATDRRFDDTDRKISTLVDSQLKTEENIRNLTAVVDRYFSEGRNGN